MNDKADIYTYHRAGGRKTRPKLRLPSLPKSTWRYFLASVASWETAFLMAVSFFAGRAVLAGGLIPFPAALLAASTVVIPDKRFWVLLASAAGLVTIGWDYSTTAAVVALVALFLTLGRTRSHLYQKWYGVPVLVMGILTVVRVGFFAYYAPELYNYIIAIFEAVLAGCASFLLIKSLPLLSKKGGVESFKKEEVIGGAVLIVALLTGMSEIRVAGIEGKSVVGRVLVLLAAYTGGSGFSAAMGTLVGMVPSITTVIAPGLVAVYSFSGLLAGMFRSFGRVGVCVGFILGNVLLSIYLNDYSRLITTFFETALAVTVFMLIPPKRLFAVRSLVKNSLFSSSFRPSDEKKIRENTARKIREYSRVFQEISRTFSEISCDVRVYEENNLQSLFNGVANKVCRGCSLHRICWDKEFYKTYRAIMEMISYIEVNGRITEENVPYDILKRCAREKELAVTVNCLFETYRQAQLWQRKLMEGRDILAGQLEGVASIMQNLANEVRIDTRMREDIEIILRSELTKAGHKIIALNVTGEGKDQLEVTVSCPSCGGNMTCKNGIAPIVSRILSQPLAVLNSNYCTKKTGEPVCEFKLTPAKALKVEMGYASTAKDCSLVSGDSWSTFDLPDGKFAVILSDGMGVGPKAAMESKATITLLEKLLETGFDKNRAVKTVNSILVLSSAEETFATVDLAVINMLDGNTDFVKVGSAASFIKHGSQVSVIRANSLPVGILNNIEVDAIQQPMHPSDVLVMVTDGILGSVEDERYETWIIDALQNILTTDPQNIADLLLNKAIHNCGGLVNDDMTVLVVTLETV